jgi:hypothetical protein
MSDARSDNLSLAAKHHHQHVAVADLGVIL